MTAIYTGQMTHRDRRAVSKKAQQALNRIIDFGYFTGYAGGYGQHRFNQNRFNVDKDIKITDDLSIMWKTVGGDKKRYSIVFDENTRMFFKLRGRTINQKYPELKDGSITFIGDMSAIDTVLFLMNIQQ